MPCWGSNGILGSDGDWCSVHETRGTEVVVGRAFSILCNVLPTASSVPLRVDPPFARWRVRSCDMRNSPKGLRRIALGCREAQRSGYPGDSATTTQSTLKGLRDVAPPLRNSFGVDVLRRLETQGSRCATTLGCPTKSLRDSRGATSSLKGKGGGGFPTTSWHATPRRRSPTSLPPRVWRMSPLAQAGPISC